ncbi:MAG: hypothetical protein MK102_15530 [Fuerstiella sp.]|nr:hypothetical protein [Fuerstiella sp.]
MGAESGAVDGECVSVNLASVIKARDSPPPDTCAVLRHAMQAIEGATSDAFIRVADPPRVGV